MAEFTPMAIARRARELIEREDGGSITAAAKRLGLTPAALARFLSGAWQWVNLDTLLALLTAYRADALWLLTGERELATARLGADARVRLAHILTGLSFRIFERHRRA